MKLTPKYYLHLVFFVALFFGTIQPNYTNDLGELQLEKIEKFRAVAAKTAKAMDDLSEMSFRNNPDAVKEFSEAIDSGVDALDAAEDAIQTTGSNSWNVIKALFKRGNDFNKKAVTNEWYDYHEIHLINGKRLDSYDDVAMEIISRKATNLSDIQTSTFQKYLDEFENKYSTGTKIRSNKYEDIDGTLLQGDYILEIPDSNQSIPNINDFINLAAENNVTIRFRPE